MTESKKKKTNYFRITSPIVNKLFWVFFSILMALGAMLFALCVVDLISIFYSEPANQIDVLFKGFNGFLESLLGLFLLFFIGFASVVIYNYSINRENAEESKKQEAAESPLTEEARKHEQEIIALLKTIAQPLPGKQKLNRARTAQFLRAMMELGYINHNTAGKLLMSWVESVTGYEDGNAGHFQQALNVATPQDSNVVDYCEQITKIVAE